MVSVAKLVWVRGPSGAVGAGRALHFAVVFDLRPLKMDALYGLRKSTGGLETELLSTDGLCVVISVACWGVVD